MATIDKISLELSHLDVKALEKLEQFYSDQPFEEELWHDYLSWKSLILLQLERPNEAIDTANTLLSAIDKKDHRYFNALHVKASAFVKMQDIPECEDVMLTGLIESEGQLFQKLSFLKLILSIKEYNSTVPRKFATHIDSLITEMGIPTIDGINYFEKLEVIRAMNRESNRRYRELVLKLNEESDLFIKRQLVLKLIDSEEIEFYRKMCKELLDSLR